MTITFLPIEDPMPAAETNNGWRDIASAPRGKTIIMFAVTDITNGRVTNWKMATGHMDYATGERLTWDGRELAVWDVRPTHWQPLPEPPK